MDAYHRWMEVCVPVSFGGLPCVTMPTGPNDHYKLPNGLQLFGKRGDDTMLLHLGHLYHEMAKETRLSMALDESSERILSSSKPK